MPTESHRPRRTRQPPRGSSPCRSSRFAAIDSNAPPLPAVAPPQACRAVPAGIRGFARRQHRHCAAVRGHNLPQQLQRPRIVRRHARVHVLQRLHWCRLLGPPVHCRRSVVRATLRARCRARGHVRVQQRGAVQPQHRRVRVRQPFRGSRVRPPKMPDWRDELSMQRSRALPHHGADGGGPQRLQHFRADNIQCVGVRSSRWVAMGRRC